MRAFCSYSWTFWVLFDTKNRPNFRVLEFFGEKSGKGSPPPLFWGCRLRKTMSFLAKNPAFLRFRGHRQAHCRAAVFCGTSPGQANIPQNRPKFRVLEFFGETSGKGNSPLYFGCAESKVVRGFEVQYEEARRAASQTNTLLLSLSICVEFCSAFACSLRYINVLMYVRRKFYCDMDDDNLWDDWHQN